jgi:multiple antibiotic resistance protein
VTELLVTAFVTLFVVIDPIGVAPLFASITPGDSAAQRRQIAVKGVAVAAGVLLTFAVGGQPLLELLGIGLPAFRIAGGLLLLLLSIDMVMVRHSGLRDTAPGEEEEGRQRADVSVFPLGIPLIAGPGALTSIVLLMGRAEGDLGKQAVVLLVAAVVLGITLLCLLATAQLMRLLGQTGINVVTRVFGIITAALAVQFILDGLGAVWPAG